ELTPEALTTHQGQVHDHHPGVEVRSVTGKAKAVQVAAAPSVRRVAHGCEEVSLAELRLPKSTQIVEDEGVAVEIDEPVLVGEGVGQEGSIPDDRRVAP